MLPYHLQLFCFISKIDKIKLWERIFMMCFKKENVPVDAVHFQGLEKL